MLSLVSRNLGLKALSVALAVTAWAYFHLAAAPGTTARFTQQLAVPIVVTGLQPGFVAHLSDKSATVAVEVPRNGAAIKPEAVQAFVDLGDRTAPGIFNAEVHVAPPAELPIKSLSPASTTIVLDRLEEHLMPAGINYTGDRPKSVVVEGAAITPSGATVRGTATDIARITTVRIDVPFQDRPGTFDAMVRPVAADARGAEVTGVQVSPNLVRVRVHFVRAASTGK